MLHVRLGIPLIFISIIGGRCVGCSTGLRVAARRFFISVATICVCRLRLLTATVVGSDCVHKQFYVRSQAALAALAPESDALRQRIAAAEEATAAAAAETDSQRQRAEALEAVAGAVAADTARLKELQVSTPLPFPGVRVSVPSFALEAAQAPLPPAPHGPASSRLCLLPPHAQNQPNCGHACNNPNCMYADSQPTCIYCTCDLA